MVATALSTTSIVEREAALACEAVNETEAGYPRPYPGHGLDL